MLRLARYILSLNILRWFLTASPKGIANHHLDIVVGDQEGIEARLPDLVAVVDALPGDDAVGQWVGRGQVLLRGATTAVVVVLVLALVL